MGFVGFIDTYRYLKLEINHRRYQSAIMEKNVSLIQEAHHQFVLVLLPLVILLGNQLRLVDNFTPQVVKSRYELL